MRGGGGGVGVGRREIFSSKLFLRQNLEKLQLGFPFSNKSNPRNKVSHLAR